MGAWGAGSFENDEAGDWVWEVESAEDTSILEEAFSAVNEAEGYLEAPECSIAIAAAEVVAAMRKRPVSKLPKEIAAFAARVGAPPPELVTAALAAIERITTESELQELWDESDKGEGWHQAVAELESRLK